MSGTGRAFRTQCSSFLPRLTKIGQSLDVPLVYLLGFPLSALFCTIVGIVVQCVNDFKQSSIDCGLLLL